MVRQIGLGPITQMYLQVLTDSVKTYLPREARMGLWGKNHSKILSIAVQAGIPGAKALEERIARHLMAKSRRAPEKPYQRVFVAKRHRNRRKVDNSEGSSTEAGNSNPRACNVTKSVT